MHSDDYYTQPNFFQMIESNTKLNEPHPSIVKGDTQEAKKLIARTMLEVTEVDRRLREADIFERRYSAKFKPD